VIEWTAVRVIAVVLAAGEGRRMGGPKALVPLGATTFLARACAALGRPGVAGVVAVLGAHAARVRREAPVPKGVRVVVNERWPDGMLSSLWTGLDAAEGAGAEAVLVHPVDNPFVEAATVDAVIAALAKGARIAVPSHGGRRGHPAGFARESWAALRAAPLDRGARAVLAERPEWVVHVEAGPDCLVDLDTPADLRASLKGLPKSEETR
jgi:CTP:molybdopterin cytidylyltransferase MocA